MQKHKHTRAGCAGSAGKRLTGRALQRVRGEVLDRDPLCAHCKAKGRTTEATEVDHILPLFKGGTDEPSNLQGLCTDCHKAKTRADLGRAERTQFDASGRVIW